MPLKDTSATQSRSTLSLFPPHPSFLLGSLGHLPDATCSRDLSVPTASVLAQVLILAHLDSDGHSHTFNDLPVLSLRTPKLLQKEDLALRYLRQQWGLATERDASPLPCPWQAQSSITTLPRQSSGPTHPPGSRRPSTGASSHRSTAGQPGAPPSTQPALLSHSSSQTPSICQNHIL